MSPIAWNLTHKMGIRLIYLHLIWISCRSQVFCRVSLTRTWCGWPLSIRNEKILLNFIRWAVGECLFHFLRVNCLRSEGWGTWVRTLAPWCSSWGWGIFWSVQGVSSVSFSYYVNWLISAWLLLRWGCHAADTPKTQSNFWQITELLAHLIT